MRHELRLLRYWKGCNVHQHQSANTSGQNTSLSELNTSASGLNTSESGINTDTSGINTSVSWLITEKTPCNVNMANTRFYFRSQTSSFRDVCRQKFPLPKQPSVCLSFLFFNLFIFLLFLSFLNSHRLNQYSYLFCRMTSF